MPAAGSRHLRDRLAGLAPVAAVAVATVATVAATVAVAAGAARAASIGATVNLTPRTGALPAGFLGLGLEYDTIPEWVGTGTSGATPGGPPYAVAINPVLVQLIRNLDPVGPPVLRIGGQSTDRSWWPVPGMARPLGVTYDLTPAWTTAAAALARATGARLLLGINLEADSLRVSQVEADELLRKLGRGAISAFAIGNEPELYSAVPWYRRAGDQVLPWYSRTGTPVFARPRSTWTAAAFASEFAATVKVMPDVPIAGPDATTPELFGAFTPLLGPDSRVRMLTSHAYPLNQCITDPRLPQYPSVPNLLGSTAATELIAGLSPFIALAHRDGATYRIDEMGPVSCNGRAGVSNTMAAALWLLDALFTLDGQGVDGVNIHTYPNAVNGLFDFSRVNGTWAATVHPLYYGALLFAQAAPVGSRLLAVRTPHSATVHVWATLGSDHHIRVTVINDSPRDAASVSVTAPTPTAYGVATVERLLAPSVDATTGVTLGAQRFAAPTTTGVLPAPYAAPGPGTVAPRGRTYTVGVPAGSAALLTLPAG